MELEIRLVFGMVIVLAKIVAAATQALPGCTETCGDVSIPYPFGIGVSSITSKSCFLHQNLELFCKDNSTLYLQGVDLKIWNIFLKGQLYVPALTSKVCRDDYISERKHGNEARLPIESRAFAISKGENSFISVGCDTYGFINNIHGSVGNTAGCLTRCNSMADVQNDGSCTGIGCCKVDIPFATKSNNSNNMSIEAHSFSNFNRSWGFNNCSYSFIAKKGIYKFSVSHLMKGVSLERVPMVVDWSVGEYGCEVSRHNMSEYICSGNSSCEDFKSGYGHRCRCNKGFEGNPYHPDGCRDIQECKNYNMHNCISEHYCRETEGSFECFCPTGESGDGKREGVGVGLLTLIVGISSVYLMHRKWKPFKLKDMFVEQKFSFPSAKIFTAKQLSKATNNYDKKQIISEGYNSTVFRGILSNNMLDVNVAIKKFSFREIDQSRIEEFLNKLVLLEQIRHRNVVPILGYCLESEVPLLVYEFFNNGTLFDKLHKRNNINFSWKTRLQIAIEAATALDYLHSGTRIPIIHSNVSSANILLDDTYTAKLLLDFCTNVSLSSMHEIGLDLYYLDPEYFHTNYLTVKSDVYSFGVVLAELIIAGAKQIYVEKPEGGFPLLAKQFILTLEKNSLVDILETGIVNKENEGEIIQVALLAAKCLRIHAKERPSMQVVLKELVSIREKHQSRRYSDLSLFDDTSSAFEHGSSRTSSVQESCTDSM
ncbi:wall-associated receptor kinase 2-like isoform X2 [Arachis stenosperma]|uniref:wall-associated receptor kinase 2-like isoform X2 n=1 Tax=Arachis stenosperma TaxID=217475 RepID=UPI0025ABDB60|nr:wall-associated receptor kinase 2-like isoform X2 [Arachis stenosperma]